MTKTFTLDRRNAKLMGVGSGLADYTGADPLLIRLGIVAAAVATGPVAIVFYIAAGLLAPAQGGAA